MAGDLKLELELDSSGAVKGVKAIENQAEKSGKKAGDSLEKGLSGAGARIKANLGKVFAGVAAVAGAALAGRAFINAASAQDDAVNKLNASLKNLGLFSQETSRDLQSFAANLQSQTTLGDEVILDQLSFAQAMGATVDQSKEILSVAADMSSALGIDLNTAVRQISKTLGGFGGELSEISPEIKALTREQLLAGGAIDVLGKKFSGFASAEAKTFSGAFTQLQNVFGDLMETVGLPVVQSPAVIAALNTITKAVGDVIASINVKELIGKVDSLITGVIGFAQVIPAIITPFEIFFNFVNTGFDTIKLGILSVVDGFAQMAQAATNIPIIGDKLPVESINNFAKSVRSMRDSVGADLMVSAEQAAQFNTDFSDGFSQTITGLQENFTRLMESTAEAGNVAQVGAETATKPWLEFGASFKKVSMDISNNVKGAIVGTVKAGVDAVVKSLITGEKGFDGFGKAVLGILGTLATQLGQTLLMTGIGMKALLDLSGVQAIAAGIGLLALGSILSSMSGGGGTSPAATGASTDVTATPTVGGPIEAVGEDEPEEIERQQQVQVQVAGDVLDSEETGLRIVDVLEKHFDTKGGRLAIS